MQVFHLGYNWVLELFPLIQFEKQAYMQFFSESCTWAHMAANLVPSDTTMHLGYIVEAKIPLKLFLNDKQTLVLKLRL